MRSERQVSHVQEQGEVQGSEEQSVLLTGVLVVVGTETGSAGASGRG